MPHFRWRKHVKPSANTALGLQDVGQIWTAWGNHGWVVSVRQYFDIHELLARNGTIDRNIYIYIYLFIYLFSECILRTFTSKSEKKGHDFTMTPSWVHPWLGHDDPTEKRIGGSSFHSLLARGTCLCNKPEAAASVWPSRACHLSLETAPMMPVLSLAEKRSEFQDGGFHRFP